MVKTSALTTHILSCQPYSLVWPQPFAEGKRRTFSGEGGPGLIVGSWSFIHQPKPGFMAPFEPTCGCPVLLQLLVNTVQGSPVSEGYQPFLCRYLRYLTVKLLAKDLKVFGLASSCPLQHPLYLPFFWLLQSFVVLWVFHASLCLGGSCRRNSYLELIAVFHQQNNSSRRSKNGIP